MKTTHRFVGMALLLAVMLGATWTMVLLIVPLGNRNSTASLTTAMLSMAEALTIFYAARLAADRGKHESNPPLIVGSVLLFIYALLVAAITADGFFGASFARLLLFHVFAFALLHIGWMTASFITRRHARTPMTDEVN